MLLREDIELIERVAIKTQKKLNCILKDNCLDIDVDNLTRKEIQTIFAIGGKGNKTMGEIAYCLGVSISTPVTIIDKLISKEYVLRQVGEEDRRQVLVSLTDRGIKLYDEVLQLRLKNLQIVIGILSEQEIEMFKIILRKIDSTF